MPMKIQMVKELLGDAASNYTDNQIQICIYQSEMEIKGYCNLKALDEELDIISARLAIIKLNRLNTEGLASQSISGLSESYVDGFPADILAVLNKKRKIKLI